MTPAMHAHASLHGQADRQANVQTDSWLTFGLIQHTVVEQDPKETCAMHCSAFTPFTSNRRQTDRGTAIKPWQ